MTALNKSTLNKLREKDPEFFEFLKEQNANFDIDQSEDDDDSQGGKSQGSASEEEASIPEDPESEEEEEEPDTDNEKVVVNEANESRRLSKTKKYKKKLEDVLGEMDDSSDEEDDNDATPRNESKQSLSLKQLNAWEKKLVTDKIDLDLIKDIASLFKSVAEKAGAQIADVAYNINSVKEYEKALNLCYAYFPRTWRKDTGTKSDHKAETNKPMMRFKRKLLRPIIKDYFCDMIKFLPEIQDKAMLKATLAHLQMSSDFIAMFPRKSRLVLKALISIWGKSENDFKADAFNCIKSILMRLKNELFIFVLKRMYLSYCNVTELRVNSANESGSGELMQQSFADLCSIDTTSAYQHAFVYIRELAIKLRTAILSKKEDDLKNLHNRKFLNLLYLWSTVLNKLHDDENLRQLIYPLAQVVIGCFRHINKNQYIPLRIHCLRCLLLLTKNTNAYFPFFGFLIDMLNAVAVERPTKRPKALTSKVVTNADLDKICKLSKSQLEDDSYKAAVLEKISDLIADYLERLCCSPAFLEATFLPVPQLKRCCKDLLTKYRNDDKICQSVATIRELLQKIEEHCKWLEFEKAKSDINLNDVSSCDNFTQRISEDNNNSVVKFCKSFRKLSERQRRVQFSEDNFSKAPVNVLKRQGNPTAVSKPILKLAKRKKLSSDNEKKVIKKLSIR